MFIDTIGRVGKAQRGYPVICWGRLCNSILALAQDETVNDDLYGMFLLLVKIDLITQVQNIPIDPHTYISRPTHLLKDALILALTSLYEGSKQHNARPLWQIQHGVNDLLHSLSTDLASAVGTMRMTDACIEQTHIVINLGYCAHCGAWVVCSPLLINRDCR